MVKSEGVLTPLTFCLLLHLLTHFSINCPQTRGPVVWLSGFIFIIWYCKLDAYSIHMNKKNMSRNDSSYWHENKEGKKRPVNKTISAQLKHNNQYLLCNRAHVLDISTVRKFPCNNSLHISANSTWKKEEEVNKLLNWVNKIAGDCCGMIWFFCVF